MNEQEQPNEVQVEKVKKSFSGMFIITILLLCTFILAIISGLWTLKLSSQVSSLSSGLKTLQTHNYRLSMLEDKLAKMEVQNRLQTMNSSIGAISKLAESFRQVDAAKADELQGVVAELQEKRDLLQKQLHNYEQAIKKPVAGNPDVPRLQAATESDSSAAAGKDQKDTSNWWNKIVNFRLFHGRK
ncbi:MAG: hypothetical protein GWP07_04235 [Xanthomonadaceae bacterium]|nr:hypothetical protein [Xanthomonadaceae bacterium]